MKAQNTAFNLKGFLKKPWVIETIFFFLILWQESFRLSLRTAKKDFSPDWLKDFYYYNFGDFVNGYVMAYIFDGLASYLFFQKNGIGKEFYKLFIFKVTETSNAILSSSVSAIIIAIFELGQSSALTTADLMDIPAGAGGAMVYCVIRLLVLKSRT